MVTPACTFTDLVLSQWRDPSSPVKTMVAISGGDLTIADVVAVSRYLLHITPAKPLWMHISIPEYPE
jgi:phenylalanine ammonia-lyase